MNNDKPSILVVGSINMDLILQTERVPVPGETFFGKEYSYVPGGKGANQAVAASRLGADVTFVGKVGDDVHGIRLKEQLESQGISTEFIDIDSESQTGLAVIMLEVSGENRIIVYPGANMKIEKKDVQKAFERSYDVVIINFEIDEMIIFETCRLAGKNNVSVVLDAGPAREIDFTKIGRLEILSPNETEAQALTGIKCRTPEEAQKAAEKLSKISESRYIVIKMGKQGALLYDDGNTEFFLAYEVEALDTTAAGDAFTAGMAVQYLQHGDISKAVKYANAAGALTVTKLGAQPSLPTKDETEEFIEKYE